MLLLEVLAALEGLCSLYTMQRTLCKQGILRQGEMSSPGKSTPGGISTDPPYGTNIVPGCHGALPIEYHDAHIHNTS